MWFNQYNEKYIIIGIILLVIGDIFSLKQEGLKYFEYATSLLTFDYAMAKEMPVSTSQDKDTLNDYERFTPESPFNGWGGRTGTWDFNGGECIFKWDSPGVLKLEYRIDPNCACGYFEPFSGRAQARLKDISKYRRFQFRAKSEVNPVNIFVEFVEFDESLPNNQGATVIIGRNQNPSKPFEVPPSGWQGFSIDLELLKQKGGRLLHWTKMKQISIKIEGRYNPNLKEGILYFDNFEFLR